MKSASAAVALGLATVAYAQSSTQSAAAGIPTNVSQACASFLNTLNGDSNINQCLARLVDATTDFNPTSSNGVASATAVTSALNTICGASFTACDSSVIRGRLADFYGACQADMLGTAGDGSNGNQSLIDIYDVLYILTPLKNAICAKDGGEYCINKIAGNEYASNGGASSTPGASDNAAQSSPGASDTNTGAAASGSGSGSSAPTTTSPSAAAASNTGTATHTGSSTAASPSTTQHARRAGAGGFPASSLYRRADNTTSQETLGGIAPEAAQYNSIGLPYLFLTPNMTQAELCTTCTSEVVGAYINFETITPYALGIANSPMLSGQIALWNKIKTCPGNFASQLLNNATSSMTGPANGGDSTDAGFAGASLGAVQVVGATLVALVGSMMLF